MNTAINHLDVMQEFATIIRGEHPGWSGDKRENAGFFLRTLRNDMPEQAKALAFDVECNLNDFSELTGLPHRTLEQAQRVLYGQWASL
jgi:hypothetical protein